MNCKCQALLNAVNKGFPELIESRHVKGHDKNLGNLLRALVHFECDISQNLDLYLKDLSKAKNKNN